MIGIHCRASSGGAARELKSQCIPNSSVHVSAAASGVILFSSPSGSYTSSSAGALRHHGANEENSGIFVKSSLLGDTCRGPEFKV